MAKKIVLFLSVLGSRPVERDYACPDGSTVKGTQTNEAPVTYLLKADTMIREIICVVTSQARETAWDRFCSTVKETSPAATVIPIPYEEDQDFSETAVPQILQHVDRGDEIYLDITGGFRNANIHLLLLTRILEYRGILLAGAVYSKQAPPEVQDIQHMIGLFDLINGMQELTSLGSARTLRKYYGSDPEDPAIGALLTAMERLTEAITLCRTAQIQSRMDALSDALVQAADCKDPLMRTLLPVFREKFGIRLKKGSLQARLTTPGLIRWCVQNDMLQQALTVYTERIPAYLRESGILVAGPNARRVHVQEYEDPDAVQFVRGFLRLSGRHSSLVSSEETAGLRTYFRTCSSEMISHLHNGTPLNPPEGIARGVENAILIARIAYLDDGKVFDQNWTDRLPENKQGLAVLKDRFSSSPPRTADGLIRSMAVLTSDDLTVLLERALNSPGNERPSRLDYVLTIRNLDKILPLSGYETIYPTDRLALICTDYIYVKMLRNLTNHAGDEVTTDWTPVLDYLKELGGYFMPDELTTVRLKQVLDDCLKHLQPPEKPKASGQSKPKGSKKKR